MADEKFGIETLKLVAKVGITLGNDLGKDLEDGKISLIEGLGLLPDVMAVSGVLGKGADIKNEFNDLSTAERAELNQYIDDTFDIPNDELELKIEKGVGVIVAIVDAIAAFKKKTD